MNEDSTRLVVNSKANNSSGGRLYGLDILRFLLAVEILMFHSRMHVRCSYGRLIDLFLHVGAVTMTAFFVLSGFVNEYAFGEMKFHEKGIIKKFYLRRLVGILPSYYLTAILYWVFLSTLTWSEWLMLLPTEVLGMQSVFSSLTTWGHNGGTWFISCILICYLFFPLLAQIVREMNQATKMLFVFVLMLLLFYLPVVTMNFETTSMYANPLVRCIEYAIGVLLASYFKERKAGEKYPIKYFGLMICAWVLFGLGLMIYIIKASIPSDYMFYSIVFLPIWMILVVGMSKIHISNTRLIKLIQYFGAIAYNMFLVQFFVWPIQRWIDGKIEMDNIYRIICVFVLCIGLASLMHILFEKPIQKKLRRFIEHAN